MVMSRWVGVEIRLGTIYCQFTQKSGLGELVKCVVNRGKRHRHARLHGFFEKDFRADMSVAFGKQKPD